MKPKDEKRWSRGGRDLPHGGRAWTLGLTLTEIASAAGIGTSTLYVYFADKEALFNEVYRRAKREAIDSTWRDRPLAPLKGGSAACGTGCLITAMRRHDQVCFMEQFCRLVFHER